jgi:hypothetical protein
MSGLSHTTDRNRFLDSKLEWLSFPAIWPFKRKKAKQGETALPIFSEDQPLPPSQRLVVIVPDGDFDLIALPRRIWNLAAPDRRKVLLMTRPCREEDEFHARVDLTTLAAIIRDPRVVVQTQLVLGQSLEQAARQCVQPNDVFVCFEEHQIHGFLKKRRLAEILAQKTHCPVYTLKGTVSEMAGPNSARLLDFLLLALCLVSLIPFFALEIWIDRNSTGTLQTIMQILAVIAEVWVINAVARNSFRI